MLTKLPLLLPKDTINNITIAGNGNYKHENIPSNIQFKKLFNFSRLSILRIFTEFSFFLYLLKSKPKIVIITTYELLASACIYKLFFKTKIIYDIQENYFLNVKTGTFNPTFIKFAFAHYIRLKERFFARFIDKFILAEKCYVSELNFIEQKFEIVENKVFSEILKYKATKSTNKLLFCITGTLGKTYGTLEGIELFKNLKIPNSELTIIGYAPDTEYLRDLKNNITNCENIQLIGGDYFVSSEKIIKCIAQSHISIQLYQMNESFQNKIPSKFYECIALDTLIMCTPNSFWINFLSKYHAYVNVKTIKSIQPFSTQNNNLINTDDIFLNISEITY